jgi:Zn-finger nucleic acid-binding protein
MNCPLDGSELRITERQGIEIDYCPQCRGVWLDRGELDKILERSAQLEIRSDRDRDDRDRYDADRSYRAPDPARSQGHGTPRRRRSFLEDLLDFE